MQSTLTLLLQCDSIIKEYFGFLWAEVEALLNDPKGLCTELGLCHTRRLDTQVALETC